MNTLVIRTRDTDAPLRSTRRSIGPAGLRALSIAVCLASVAVASQVGDPSVAIAGDPELAILLRGMAVLKGLLAVGAFVLLLWRCGHPIVPRLAVASIASVALMAGAATMIWRLQALPPAAIAFHVGLFAALIIAWHDDGLPTRSRSIERA